MQRCISTLQYFLQKNIQSSCNYLPIFISRNWEVRNSAKESYFINICGKSEANVCGKGVSVCKKSGTASSSYGASAADPNNIPTKPYGKGFSITFNSTANSKTGCENKMIQTEINFQCDTKLVSQRWILSLSAKTSILSIC